MTTRPPNWTPSAEGEAAHREAYDRSVACELLTVDGETVRLTLAEFFADNPDEDKDALRALAPGETYHGGGGAAPTWSITRIK